MDVVSDQQRTDSMAWPSVLIVLLLVVTNAWVIWMPLVPDRPPPSGAGASTSVIQDRDARLWQDPFSILPKPSRCWELVAPQSTPSDPAAMALPRLCPAQAPAPDHDMAWLRGLIQAHACNGDGQVHVFYALVPGGTWVGADEARRRARYALLAGANVQGFVPEDSEHLGYVEHRLVSAIDPGATWTVRLPFEWLVAQDKNEHLLILWVDEETLGQAIADVDQHGASISQYPLTRLFALVAEVGSCVDNPFCKTGDARSLEGLCPRTPRTGLVAEILGCTVPRVHHRIIGPSSSTFLRAATRNPNLKEVLLALGNCDVAWYSPAATLPDAKLHVTLEGESRPITELLPGFQRLHVADDQMAKALVSELRLRHALRPGQAIALVGLWDTAYSRRLRALIEQAVEEQQEGKQQRDKTKVLTASYLRGLDGRMPANDTSAEDAGKGGATEGARPVQIVERAEGDQQMDYLRRLALHLKGWQHDQRKRITAIGIIGDDYHDKLLALQALRPSFPGAVFFATDLNAAMLRPTDNRVTRNLVVASGFGLTLRSELQKDVPPFRISYQTARFLAAQVALGDGATGFSLPQPPAQASWSRYPLLFEIGYTEAVPIGRLQHDDDCAGAECFPSPHPLLPSPPDWYFPVALPLVVLLIGLVLWFVGVTPSRGLRGWAGAVIAVAILSLGLWWLLQWHPADREPFRLLQGVSIWPSVLLRLLAALIAWKLLRRGRRLLREMYDEVEKQYPELKTSSVAGGTAVPQPRLLEALKRCRARMAQIGSVRDVLRLWQVYRRAELPAAASLTPAAISPLAVSAGDAPATGGSRPAAAENGAANAAHEPAAEANGAKQLPAALCLPDVIVAVLFILLFFGLAVSLILLLGEAPNTPTRGGVEWVLNFLVLFLAVVSFLLLLYRATVESLRAVWLARRLMEHDGWPARLRARFMPVGEPRPGLIKPVFDAVDRRLDAELIARVTQPVQRLIFYPFIVLALLMFSRSELLDAWNLPAMLLVLFVIYIALLVLAAWRLRVTAEELRQRADRSLDDLIAATGIRGDEALTKQLRAMREHLRGLRIGAFAPFSQQPLVHAALTVIGSSSGIALLEIARTANI